MRVNTPITDKEYVLTDGRTIVSTTDLQGNIQYANPYFIEVSGFTEEELIGAPQNLVRHPDMPVEAFAAGLGDHRIVTTLCPGGKERMRRLMHVVASGRLDLQPLVTHRFRLEQIEDAYELFANQRNGVLKVAIIP